MSPAFVSIESTSSPTPLLDTLVALIAAPADVAKQTSEEMPSTLKEQLSRHRKLTLVVKCSGAERGLPDSIIRTGVFATSPAVEVPLPSCYMPHSARRCVNAYASQSRSDLGL